ncbi:MAG: LysR family transcriptional regulator, partial [Clostridia bacterium]|nr:LysR family transcriptional regulator [Clostridia bacterium]
MNLQYYYNFVTIVEEGSLTAASRKLHIAQPALSNQIKAMEEKYGTRLFFRGARRLELTDAGMILYQKAKRMCVKELLDEEPVVTAGQLKLWDWMSRYYLC